MCERWRRSFENFLEDMGERPKGMTLDRIDGSRGYSPDNCRWATMKEQTINRKGVRLFDWGGQRLTISDIARAAGIPRTTLTKRFKRLGDINAAVSSR